MSGPTPLLPPARSLREELAAALKAGQPLVVMVSLDGCVFCKMARESYLAPARRDRGLPVVQVDMKSSQPLRDFQDTLTTHDAMVRAWGAKVTPTVIFFGRDGVEVAERLVGGYIPDFYGAYLDERLERSRRALRA